MSLQEAAATLTGGFGATEAQPMATRLPLYVTSTRASVRPRPGWSHPVVRRLEVGTVLEASRTRNGWLEIRPGQWVTLASVDRVTTTKTRWTTQTANVRYGPSTAHSVVDELPSGRRMVGEVVDGWQRIGNHRWVSTSVSTWKAPARSDGPATSRTHVDTGRKVVHLTFDDGPNPTYTPQMLAMLRKHDAKATFFMVGNEAARHPGLVKDVRSAGHAVGNHSWDHPVLTKLSSAQVVQQLSSTRQKVGSGECFRAPYGAVNDAVHVAAGKAGYRWSWLWNVDPEDWKRPGTQAIADAVVKGARPGAVYVMHDGGGNRSQTVAGVDRAITTLKAKGYRFESLPGC